MRCINFLFIIHIQAITFIQASYCSNIMSEEEQVCTNILKTISASQYIFFFIRVLINGERREFVNSHSSPFFLYRTWYLQEDVCNPTNAILIEILSIINANRTVSRLIVETIKSNCQHSKNTFGFSCAVFFFITQLVGIFVSIDILFEIDLAFYYILCRELI